MLADAHREKALRIEQSIVDLGDPTIKPHIVEALIELSWAAAFQWIAVGCQQKHGKHKENHHHLVSYLNDIGEPTVSQAWDAMEKVRAGGFYGSQATLENVERATRLLQEIRVWALS
jgi:hypothetical protein